MSEAIKAFFNAKYSKEMNAKTEMTTKAVTNLAKACDIPTIEAGQINHKFARMLSQGKACLFEYAVVSLIGDVEMKKTESDVEKAQAEAVIETTAEIIDANAETTPITTE